MGQYSYFFRDSLDLICWLNVSWFTLGIAVLPKLAKIIHHISLVQAASTMCSQLME